MAILCADMQHLIPTYLDRELASQDLFELEHHVSQCETCRAQLDEEAGDHQRLRALLAGPSAPASLRRQVSQLLDAEDRAARVGERQRPLVWALPVTASLAAAAALAVFAVDNSRQPTRTAAVAAPSRAARTPIIRPEYESPLPGVLGGAAAQMSPLAEPPSVSLHGYELVFRVATASGQHEVTVHVVDADEASSAIDPSEIRKHLIFDGLELWSGEALGLGRVTVTDHWARRGYIVTSDLEASDLLDLVVGSDLLEQAAAAAP